MLEEPISNVVFVEAGMILPDILNKSIFPPVFPPVFPPDEIDELFIYIFSEIYKFSKGFTLDPKSNCVFSAGMMLLDILSKLIFSLDTFTF